MPPGLDHRALLYDGEEHVVAAAGAYVREGLERGEPVWMITGTPQMDAVLRSLGSDAADVDTTAMDAWYGTPARTLTMLTRRLSERHGDARPRALGEIPLAGASPGAQRDWLRLEALVDHAFAERPATMLCLYDVRRLPEDVLAHARRSHRTLIEAGSDPRPSPSYAGPELVLHERQPPSIDPVPAHAASLRFDDRPSPAREFVTTRAADAGLRGPALDDLRVAASEIVDNAILHGRRPHWVHVWTTDAAVICEVQDGGGGIESPLTGFLLPPLERPGGRGVWIARQLCDRVEVAGARVRLHMAR